LRVSYTQISEKQSELLEASRNSVATNT
jgi:hypothetical protein